MHNRLTLFTGITTSSLGQSIEQWILPVVVVYIQKISRVVFGKLDCTYWLRIDLGIHGKLIIDN